MKRKSVVLLIGLVMFSISLFSQSMQNYTFTTSTNATLTDMSSGTIDLISCTGQEQDNVSSNVVTFPDNFEFWFMGQRYTQFSVNTNGILRLGETQISSTQTNIGSAGMALISPLTRNNSTTNLALNSTGKIHYKLEGVYPNRVLTIEWKDMEIDKTSSANYANGTFQVQLQEITNEIRIVYKNGICLHSSANTTNYQVGISSSNTSNTVHSAINIHSGTLNSTVGSSPNSNTCVAGQAIGNLQNDRMLKYTPNAPTGSRSNLTFSSITQTSITLNWSGTTDAWTAIYYSTDNVVWKYATRVSATTTSATISGLKCGTVYYWKIYSVTAEGRFSSPLDGVQATSDCRPLTNGFWHDSSVWPGNSVPTAQQNVYIPSPRQIIVNSFTNDALCNNLTIENGASLTLATSKKLIINGSLSLSGDLNVPTTTGCDGGGNDLYVCYPPGTCIQSDVVPIYRGTHTKVRMQFLYLASESEVAALDGKVIGGITFKYGYLIGGSGQPSFNITNVKIRMAHTSTSSFTSAFLNPSDFYQVASFSSLTFYNGIDNEIYIPFSSGFLYNKNMGNILMELTYETDGNTQPYVSVYRCGVIPPNTHIYTANNCSGDPQNISYDTGCPSRDVGQGSARPGLKISACQPENWGSFNASIDIYGNWTVNNTGQFNPVLGTVSFVGSADQTITPRTHNTTPPINTFYNLKINKTENNKSVTITNTNNNDSIVVTNKLSLLKGIIKTQANNGVSIRNNSSYSLEYSLQKNQTGWINGNLRRRIANNTDVYGFPLGTQEDYRLVEIVNKNLNGITYIDANYTDNPDKSGGDALDPQKALDFNTPYDEIINAEWKLTPNSQPTSGSYDIRLYWDDGRNVNVYSLENNKFGILKRSDNSSNYFDFEAIGDIENNDGEGRTLNYPYALRKNLNSFSKFTIAKTFSVLPVELINFSANCQNNGILFSWVVGYELNNEYYVIEKNTGNNTWQEIAKIWPNKNNNGIYNYFIEEKTFNDNIIYRLLQKDFNGHLKEIAKTYLNCNDNKFSNYILITKNADAPYYQLTVNSDTPKNLYLKIYDISGKMVYSSFISKNEGLDIYELEIPSTKGLYLLSIYDNENVFNNTFKIVNY